MLCWDFVAQQLLLFHDYVYNVPIRHLTEYKKRYLRCLMGDCDNL